MSECQRHECMGSNGCIDICWKRTNGKNHHPDAGFEFWWAQYMPDATQSQAISAWNSAQPKQEQGEPVAFEHPPWTRIEDAKPVVGQPVLVFYKGFAFPDTAVWTGVGCGWARDEEFDWQWDEVVNPITHWMPLPAGPDYHCTTPQQRKPLWIDTNDKMQAKFLPNIGEPVLFCHEGKTYYGRHTGGSFQYGAGVTKRDFNTWECRWMYLPAAHGIKE